MKVGMVVEGLLFGVWLKVWEKIVEVEFDKI